MTTETQARLEGKFDWHVPEIATSFVQGDDALALYEALGNVPHNLTYDEENKLIKGSSNIGAARIDTLVRPLGIRVATLRDLSRPEVMERVRGRHYADTPALTLVSAKDSYERNNSIIAQLTDLIEQENGRVKFPLLVTGYDFQPDETNTDYGARVIARDDFRALHDERLQGRNNGKRFSEVDEEGIPIFDSKGGRTFYIKDIGLSRLVLYNDLDLDSNWNDLDYSDAYGRVVLVSGEASAQNFLAELRKRYEAEKGELEARFDSALKVLKGKE